MLYLCCYPRNRLRGKCALIFNASIQLKNGQTCILRSAEAADAAAFVRFSLQVRAETDYLLAAVDEAEHDPVKVEQRLNAARSSPTDIQICAFVDGVLVGSAGVTLIRNRRKMLHRAEFGISILQAYNGLGIGNALTEQCITCAKQAGFLQLELEVVAENEKAIRLYQKHGFVEYGRNPLGFRCDDGHWQELVLMRLELGDR